MIARLRAAFFAALLGAAAFLGTRATQCNPAPAFGQPAAPAAQAPPWQPAPRPPAGPNGGSSFVNGRSHEGEELDCDLPGAMHIKNIGSKLDGAGMCVFSSIEMAALLQGMDEWKGCRDWWASKYPGGGYPSKVDKLVKAYADQKHIPLPPYVQWEGKDPRPILTTLAKTGRMACITYGYSPRYGGGRIAHMVCSPKFSGQYAVVLDNNFPGESAYEWMSKDELVKRMGAGPGSNGSSWVFAWLTAPPPPPPK